MMKTNLLSALITCIICLPVAHTQVLTPIPDTTIQIDTVVQDFDSYVAVGLTARVNLGYQEMRRFYEEVGFDYLNLLEYVTAGFGLRYKQNIHFNAAFELSFPGDDTEDVELANSHTLSFQERGVAIHLLLGYQFWQKRHKSLIFHTGWSWLSNRTEIVERRPQAFDFNTANIDVSEGVRSWPAFIHRQGALHVALQLKMSYPRPRWWSTDLDLKLGFVTGLNRKQWSVEPGPGLNIPVDVGQYLYISGTYHFF
ncbi:MAG: hypothetical protein AAFN81_06610 [Bacteroidota bacterium]